MSVDPAYTHEMEVMADLCREFVALHDDDSFIGQLLLVGQITAQAAVIWKLSEPGGLIDPATLFERPGEKIVRESA